MTTSDTKAPRLAPVGEDASAELEGDGVDRVQALVIRARAGDTGAWARLYQDFFDALYRHVGYLTHDPSVAEDLVQESFARALTCLDRFDGRSSFSTWLHGIAINVVRRHWRSSARRDRAHRRLEGQAMPLAPRPSFGDPEGSHMRKQRARALLGVLETLPDKLREAYVLVDLRQLGRDEAAAQLGITVGNLSVRATRARAKIRDELARLGWMASDAGGSS